MFPVIFTVTLERSSAAPAATSGLLCLAIVGGAILPYIYGMIADAAGLHTAYFLPAAAYAVIVFIALAATGVRRSYDQVPWRLPPGTDTREVMEDRARIGKLYGQLSGWLCDAAYPLWATRGVDPRGGFHERLAQDGEPLAEPRRSRQSLRQAYCYAMAPTLGWRGTRPRW